MSDIIKVNDELTVILDENSMTIKKNGLTITIQMSEMEVIADELQKLIGRLSNKIKSQIIDQANEGKDKEL